MAEERPTSRAAGRRARKRRTRGQPRVTHARDGAWSDVRLATVPSVVKKQCQEKNSGTPLVTSWPLARSIYIVIVAIK
jgi:hypothetical protein